MIQVFAREDTPGCNYGYLYWLGGSEVVGDFQITNHWHISTSSHPREMVALQAKRHTDGSEWFGSGAYNAYGIIAKLKPKKGG